MGSPHANKTPKTYPAGTSFGDWRIEPDDGSLWVRRYVTEPCQERYPERYPRKKYKHLVDHPEELQAFVVRLNGDDPDKRRAREVAEIKHAYISEEFLQKYYDEILTNAIKSEKDRKTNFKYLVEYGLHFFMVKLEVHSPRDWEKHQGKWARALLNRDEPIPDKERLLKPGAHWSGKVIRYIIWEMNRFLQFLHKQRKEEIPLIILDPIPKQKLDDHDAKRKLDGEVDESKYVTDAHWDKIKAEMQKTSAYYAPLIYLCRHYGLRRNEGLGLTLDDLRNDHLRIEKQLSGYVRDDTGQIIKRNYDTTKGKNKREVPHKYAGNPDLDLVYEWIEKTLSISRHYDDVSKDFAKMTQELCGERYNIDDLRPTFITDAMGVAIAEDPKNGPENVRLAAGHANLKTTYDHYVKDTRKLGNQAYVPKKKLPPKPA